MKVKRNASTDLVVEHCNGDLLRPKRLSTVQPTETTTCKPEYEQEIQILQSESSVSFQSNLFQEEHMRRVKNGDTDASAKKLIDTHINDTYVVKKPRLQMHSAKDDMKGNLCPEIFKVAPVIPQNLSAMSSQRSLKSHQGVFRTVKELSDSNEPSSGLPKIDMNAALKALVFHDNKTNSLQGRDEFFSAPFDPEFLVPGSKPPSDLTLKTVVKVGCMSSVKWFHRTMLSSTYIGLPEDSAHFGDSRESDASNKPVPTQRFSSKALISWVYPQHVLPPSVISFYTSSTCGADGIDFWNKRQVEWEDSFQSLYSMLQQSVCNIFYVCTSQYVVMFLASKSSSHSRCAYISRSTRTLRCLLNKHNVHFSMPLCHMKVEQPKHEDLMELREIEKQNLGQTRRPRPSYEIDGSHQSLLAIHGIYEVHGLYNFLLNYRSSISSSPGADVPLLYSPVPFWNAAISAPQMKCAEMKRVDPCSTSQKEASLGDSSLNEGSSQGYFSSIEVKDRFIPPWIISRLCSLISTKGSNFDLSFVTEHVSIGLNAALETHGVDNTARNPKDFQEICYISDEPEAVLSSSLSMGFMKRLKHSDDGYLAFLSKVLH